MPTRPPASGSCRTSVEGEECYQEVSAVGDADGCAKHPQRFSPLTNSSSFEDFQPHLHGAASFPGVCPNPCAHGRQRLPCQYGRLYWEAAARLSRAKSATRKCSGRCRRAGKVGCMVLSPDQQLQLRGFSGTCTAPLSSPACAPSPVHHGHSRFLCQHGHWYREVAAHLSRVESATRKCSGRCRQAW